MYAEELWTDQVELKDTRGCAVADFSVSFNGRVSARVITRDGTPIAHVALKLIATTDGAYPERVAQTDALGRVVLEHVPPGRFVLGFDVPVSGSDSRVTQFYLPGTSDRAEARPVRVGPSDTIAVGDFVIPDTMRFVTMTGTVQYPDGKAVEGASVYLKVGGADSSWIEPIIRTQSDGRFAFALLEEHEYRLLVEVFAPPQGIARAELTGILAGPNMKPVVLIPIRK